MKKHPRKKPLRKKRPLVVIEFNDHTETRDDSGDGWVKADERDDHSGEARLFITGWIIKETKYSYVIASVVCRDDGDTGRLWTVVKGAIIRKFAMPARFALEGLEEAEEEQKP